MGQCKPRTTGHGDKAEMPWRASHVDTSTHKFWMVVHKVRCGVQIILFAYIKMYFNIKFKYIYFCFTFTLYITHSKHMRCFYLYHFYFLILLWFIILRVCVCVCFRARTKAYTWHSVLVRQSKDSFQEPVPPFHCVFWEWNSATAGTC